MRQSQTLNSETVNRGRKALPDVFADAFDIRPGVHVRVVHDLGGSPACAVQRADGWIIIILDSGSRRRNRQVAQRMLDELSSPEGRRAAGWTNGSEPKQKHRSEVLQ